MKKRRARKDEAQDDERKEEEGLKAGEEEKSKQGLWRGKSFEKEEKTGSGVGKS